MEADRTRTRKKMNTVSKSILEEKSSALQMGLIWYVKGGTRGTCKKLQVLAAGPEVVHVDSVWEFSWSRVSGGKARAPSWV